MKKNPETLILIVDDQPDNLDTIMGYLKESAIDYKFSQAMNGEIACKVAGKRLPDLIIMDWEMPVMNGYDALLCIKSNPLTTDIPVIMATGRSSAEDLDKALNAGAADYIRKPIEKQELLARVRTCLSISQLIKEIKFKNEKLGDLNREKDGMVDIVAHDLKSPLNSIKGFVDLIRLEGELNNEQEKHAESINVLINEGRSLIGDILDIHTYENSNSALKVSNINLKEFIASWKNNYQHSR
jgi:two-component system, sensor histidine kinase and response regulator